LTILRPLRGWSRWGPGERVESSSPTGRVAITINTAASYAFMLAPYSRELPHGDDPSDAPASTFSSLSGPPECANRVCQPRPPSVGTLWGLRGHEAASRTANPAITIYEPERYVHRMACLPEATAQNANTECQPRPPGFGTLCRWVLRCPRCPLSTAHCPLVLLSVSVKSLVKAPLSSLPVVSLPRCRECA
jgi:hypothetical protein